ncbi:MAG: Y-family DNA polymerase [Alphaproteobacteria bacterium]
MSIFALVDCNNFYASCERIFRPDLENKPILVLSNNDGCVIARSEEVKKLGIKMGQPYFQVKHLIKKHQIEIFSSNFALYGDISKRVMTSLKEFCPRIELYSIDEAFLDLSSFKDPYKYGEHIRDSIRKWIGIPVSIGIGRTKTLAKLANLIAKKDITRNNVFSLDKDNEDEVLNSIDIGDVWGIGKNWSKFLRQNNINTAKDIRDADNIWIRNHLHVVGAKTQYELRGTSCISIETDIKDKKSITVSRSFGKAINTLEALREAVISHISKAGEKVRKAKLEASYLIVYTATDKFKENYYKNSSYLALPFATDNTLELIKYSNLLIEKIYQPGFNYKKAGIILSGLRPKIYYKASLFDNRDIKKSTNLMSALDTINANYGSKTVFFGGAGIKNEWEPIKNMLSPCYTTSWKDILNV